MNALEWILSIVAGFVIVILAIFGFMWVVNWMQSPENNRGYCIEIAYKTVYIPDAGWSDYDLQYHEKQLPYCVEWENYKP